MSKATKANKARAIEWAEYVLPIYEKHYPEDDRPRKAIEAARTNAVSPNAAFTAARARASDAAARATSDAASYVAASAAARAAYAAYAASYVASASASAAAAYAASASAAAAAEATFLEGYGEDIIKVRKVLLLKEFIDFYGIKWIDYKPEQFWDIMLEQYCSAKSCAAIENEATKL